MAESQWDEQLKRFLKKTGEDLKRAGADIKVEAQKLIKEVQDPARQKKVKEGLRDLGTMAKKAAEEVATAVEAGVKKAEEALKPKARTAPSEGAAPTPPSPPPEGMPAAKKSIGGKKRSGAARPKTPKAGKTIGRKRS